jgi:hypothetical protein
MQALRLVRYSLAALDRQSTPQVNTARMVGGPNMRPILWQRSFQEMNGPLKHPMNRLLPPLITAPAFCA